MKMESHWTETPSGKNSLNLLGQMRTIENYGSLLLAHQNLITENTGDSIDLDTGEIQVDIEGMLMKKQMHRIAVR